MTKNKFKTVDEIIAHYHKSRGKSFEERIGKFEELHDSENIHQQQLSHHVDYTIFGKPGSEKDFPGAYNEAYKVLDKAAEHDDDKIDDEKKLTEIIERYVDTFLEKAMGSRYKETIEHAKSQGQSDEDIRNLKDQLFGQYHTDDNGRPIAVLSELAIKKRMKGKKKIYLVDYLKSIAERNKKAYSAYLGQKITEGLFSDEDRLPMAQYIRPKFEEKGLFHKDDPVMKDHGTQLAEYQLLLVGKHDDLIGKLGYKHKKEE